MLEYSDLHHAILKIMAPIIETRFIAERLVELALSFEPDDPVALAGRLFDEMFSREKKIVHTHYLPLYATCRSLMSNEAGQVLGRKLADTISKSPQNGNPFMVV
jgi:hypothetical protein